VGRLRKTGILECWNAGMLGEIKTERPLRFGFNSFESIIPLFHYSTVPVAKLS
jgi:hypothetical protein